MKPRTKSLLIKYGISAGICLVIAALYIAGADILTLDLKDQMRILCDAFALPGMLCVFVGLLIWAANEGAFDGIGYVLSYALRAIMPGPQNKRESYKDYLARKEDKGKSGFGFLLITGLVFVLIGAVFLVLFYQV